MQIDAGISEVNVVTFSGGAARPLLRNEGGVGAGIPEIRSKPF